MGYDYHNGDTRKYGNSNLFRRLDKDNITSQSTVSIVIGTGNICRDKMVCERLAGNKGILLEINGLLIIIVRLFFILLMYHQIPLNIIKNIEI